MSRFTTAAVVALLLLSAVVTALTAGVLSPGNAPDERHHYSYVKYVAEHPLEIPPRYERMKTGEGDANHLVHPPLYYLLMAVPYRMLDVDRQLSSVGEELDEHGLLSMRAAVPPLRAVSLLFAAIHLLGLFLLLRYLVASGLLPGWGAVVAAACLALVPGFIFIAATLNNDVLALAVWPLLVLFTIRFVRQGWRMDAYAAIALVAAAVLTKATLWVLAAICALAVAAGVAAALRRGGRGFNAPWWRLWSRLGPRSGGEWALAGIAILAVTAVVVTLGMNLLRYGDLQPGYHEVRGLPIEQSKFYNVPEGGVVRMDPLEFADWATTLTLRSLFGILSHNERLYSPHPGRIAQLVVALAALGVLLAGWRLARGRTAADRLGPAMILTALAFIAIYLVRTYGGYHRYGHFGAQGRYLIGYVDLWVLGSLILVARAREVARRSWSRLGAGFVAVVMAGGLIALFVHPFFYLSRTVELHARTEMDRHVREAAERRGLLEVDLRPLAPQRFVAAGAGHSGGLLPSPRFLMGWRGSVLEGAVKTTEGCLEVWVYGIGERAWGQPVELEIALRSPGAAEQESIELPAHPEVAQALLPAPEAGRAILTVHASNVRAPAPWPLLDELWPRTRIPQIFSVYAGPRACG